MSKGKQMVNPAISYRLSIFDSKMVELESACSHNDPQFNSILIDTLNQLRSLICDIVNEMKRGEDDGK